MEWGFTIFGVAELIDRAVAAGANVQPLVLAAMAKSAYYVQTRARERAPHRTGTLQRSILVEVGYPISRVNVNERYGLYIERGTRPHDILPKTKQALFWKGAAYPVKIVHHPGTKAHPFLEPAVIISEPYVYAQFQTVGRLVTEQMAGIGI